MKTIIQTSIPHYRSRVYEYASGLLPGFRVISGREYFTPNLSTVAEGRPWCQIVVNKFLFGNKICWQYGIIKNAIKDEIVLCELNPRILSTILLIILRKILRRKSIFWGHLHGLGNRPLILQLARNIIFSLSDGAVLYTDTDAKKLVLRGYLKPIWVTNNSCLSEADCTSNNGKQTDFVYVGRLVVQKKVSLLIHAFKHTLNRHPSARLQIVGDGLERENLENLVNSLGLAHQVTFWGEISDPLELKKIYVNCIAAVSPGYVGLSAIQALGNGIPILVADDEPHAPEIEVCVEGKTALFFTSGNPEALASVMISCLNNKLHWANCSEELASIIRSKYTIESTGKALVSALEWGIENAYR